MGKHVGEPGLSILTSIDRWKEIAIPEIEEIGDWREEASEYFASHRQPQREGDRWQFLAWTQVIISRIASHHPGIDSRVIIRIYEAITTWYEDRSADGLPTQSALKVLLDSAILTVNAVYDAILESATEAVPQDSETVRIGGLEINIHQRRITFNGQSHAVKNPRAFQVFLTIATAHPALVETDDIRKKVPGCNGRIDKILRDHLPLWIRQMIPGQRGRKSGYSLSLPGTQVAATTRPECSGAGHI